MTTYCIDATYNTGAQGYISFPGDKSWADVAEWYIKWDCLNVRFSDEVEWREFAINSDTTDTTDWKRPICVTVHPVTEGMPDFDIVVAED